MHLHDRFTLVNSSLRVWEGNEYVSAACFEFLAALYAKCVTHDFPGTMWEREVYFDNAVFHLLMSSYVDFNEVLLKNGLSFLERLNKSKSVIKAVTSFLEKIYQQSGEAIVQLPVSSSILVLLVGQ